MLDVEQVTGRTTQTLKRSKKCFSTGLNIKAAAGLFFVHCLSTNDFCHIKAAITGPLITTLKCIVKIGLGLHAIHSWVHPPPRGARSLYPPSIVRTMFVWSDLKLRPTEEVAKLQGYYYFLISHAGCEVSSCLLLNLCFVLIEY